MRVNGCPISVHISNISHFTHAHLHTCHIQAPPVLVGVSSDHSHAILQTIRTYIQVQLLIKEVDVINHRFPWQWDKYMFIYTVHAYAHIQLTNDRVQVEWRSKWRRVKILLVWVFTVIIGLTDFLIAQVTDPYLFLKPTVRQSIAVLRAVVAKDTATSPKGGVGRVTDKHKVGMWSIAQWVHGWMYMSVFTWSMAHVRHLCCGNSFRDVTSRARHACCTDRWCTHTMQPPWARLGYWDSHAVTSMNAAHMYVLIPYRLIASCVHTVCTYIRWQIDF